jgi:hypothetical protein
MDKAAYAAPSLRVIGSVASLTQFGNGCFLGKTTPSDKDLVGYIFHAPIGS